MLKGWLYTLPIHVCFVCFSCVYKCVCKQFSERLYSDLIQYMSKHLEEKNEEFQAWVCMSISSLLCRWSGNICIKSFIKLSLERFEIPDVSPVLWLAEILLTSSPEQMHSKSPDMPELFSLVSFRNVITFRANLELTCIQSH